MANTRARTTLTFPKMLLALMMLAGLVSAASSMELSGSNENEYGLKLLAVTEQGEGLTAGLFLKLAPGTGNVFIQAEPVTKLDTRTSIRLAKETVCQTIDAIAQKCGTYDFFYRLEANASLVGGPSAGAAAAALTVAALDEAQINKSVAVTGTINSGGLVGQVGGLKDKIQAASAAGLAEVLIPDGERYLRNVNTSRMAPGETLNSTVDMVDYGKSIGVNVVEVNDIQEVLLHLTGRDYTTPEKNLDIDKHYSEVMDKLAGEICGRSQNLSSYVTVSDIDKIQKNIESYSSAEAQPDSLLATGEGKNIAQKIFESAKNLSAEGLKKEQSANHYSAASLCFGANVRYNYLQILSSNITSSDALKQINYTADQISDFEKKIPEAKTLADMQVRGTVKQRLQEAKQLLQQSTQNLQNRNAIDGLYNLAFAEERLGSANAWNTFMTGYDSTGATASSQQAQYTAGKNESLRDGCVTRLQEADEHIQYLDFYLPGLLKSDDELGPVYSYLRENDYTSCIYAASLVTAKANAMLSALSGNENLTKVIDKKITAAKNSIIKQTEKGEFPIISYSYYEYANSLKQSDPPSALLFSEYALELSNLDVYLKDGALAGQVGSIPSGANGAAPGNTNRAEVQQLLLSFCAGIVAGVLAMAAVLNAKKGLGRKKLIVRARTKAKAVKAKPRM